MRNKRHPLYSLFLFLPIILFIFFVLEITIRIISPANIFHPMLLLRPKVKIKFNVSLNGVSPTGSYSTNKWGLRGDEPPLKWDEYYTIITVGGSTTLCFYLDDHKTWPYLLQEKLRQKYPKVWVGNGGLDGNTTRGHLIFMQHVIPKIKPNAVIFLIGLNDLGLSIDAGRRRYGTPFEKSNLKRWLWGRSRLVQVLYIWKAIIFDKVALVETKVFEKNPSLRH